MLEKWPSTLFSYFHVCNMGAWVKTAAKHLSSMPSQRRWWSYRARHRNVSQGGQNQPSHLPVWECDCRCRAVEERCGVYQQQWGWGLLLLKRAKCRGKQSLMQTVRHAPVKKIKSHVQSGHVEGLPRNTCNPQCLAIPRSIFETRRKLTRHELLARQPHRNHAQVIHSRGPGCGIGDRHVELGSV